MELMSDMDITKNVDSYENLMIDAITIVAHETGWTIDTIMDMGPTQFFLYTKTISRIFKDNKNEAEFLGKLNSSTSVLGGM
jgi:hypothetical protein